MGLLGGGPPIPKAFVYQMVIFTTAAVGNAIGGGSGRVIDPLALLTLARGSRKRAHTSKDCMEGVLQDKKHRKGQAIKMHHSTLDGLPFK